MFSLAEQVAERVKAFPTEQQREVLHYVEFLASKLNLSTAVEQSLQENQRKNNETEPSVSFAEAAHEYIGCLDGGPEDLSTNENYMEGFGEV